MRNLTCKNCNKVVGTVSSDSTLVQGVCGKCKNAFLNCGAIQGIEDMKPSDAQIRIAEATRVLRETKAGG